MVRVYTKGLRQVSEATITAQSVQPQGEILEEGRKKYKAQMKNMCISTIKNGKICQSFELHSFPRN